VLRRDVLPVLEQQGVRLFAIGIGSAESAASFADKLDFPADMLLADESEENDAYAAVGTRNSGRDDTGKAIFEGIETMWSKRTMDGLKVRGRDDLNSIVGSLFRPGIFVPLMPKASTQQKTIEKTMVQGGTFVFDGTKEIFSHYDFSNGDQPDYDEVVRIASGRA